MPLKIFNLLQPNRIVLALLWSLFVTNAMAQTYTVTSAADAGAGTLREAIEAANEGDYDRIEFNISGDATITLDSILPPITQAGITIDGNTQPGYEEGMPAVHVTAGFEPEINDNGIRIQASNVTLSGLQITGFHHGVVGQGDLEGVKISGNVVGNGESNGVVFFYDGEYSNTEISYNYIGTNAFGDDLGGDISTGIVIAGGHEGLTVSGNVVDNIGTGVAFNSNILTNSEYSNTEVSDNYIGTNPSRDESRVLTGLDINGNHESLIVSGNVVGYSRNYAVIFSSNREYSNTESPLFVSRLK